MPYRDYSLVIIPASCVKAYGVGYDDGVISANPKPDIYYPESSHYHAGWHDAQLDIKSGHTKLLVQGELF